MIDAVEFRMIRMELVSPFVTSFGAQIDRDVLLVALHADGITGWGECTAAKAPFYSAETAAGCLLILREFMLEGLRSGTIDAHPEKYYTTAGYIRGNKMAHAALEAALWDLHAQRYRKPLHSLFGGEREELLTGVSVGIQKDVPTLVDMVGDYAEQGYQRIKIKIKPGWDIEPVKQIKEKLGNVPVMVDANGAYTFDDIDIFKELDQFDLMMIEQPFAYTDYVDHARLQSSVKTPICLDESITSVDSVKTAISLGACKIVNIKQGRVSGITEAIAVHDICKGNGIPVWAGGMLETGIGRSLNIALASLPNFSLPGDVSASDRYWHQDIISPAVTFKAPGVLAVPDKPGRGYEIDMDFLDAITIHKEMHELR